MFPGHVFSHLLEHDHFCVILVLSHLYHSNNTLCRYRPQAHTDTRLAHGHCCRKSDFVRSTRLWDFRTLCVITMDIAFSAETSACTNGTFYQVGCCPTPRSTKISFPCMGLPTTLSWIFHLCFSWIFRHRCLPSPEPFRGFSVADVSRRRCLRREISRYCFGLSWADHKDVGYLCTS